MNPTVSALVGTIENHPESTSESDTGSFTLTRQQRPQPQVGSKRRPRQTDKHVKNQEKMRQELNNSIRLTEQQIEQLATSMRMCDGRIERVNDLRIGDRMNDRISGVSDRIGDRNDSRSERVNDRERINESRISGVNDRDRLNESRISGVNDRERMNESRVSGVSDCRLDRMNDSRISDRMNDSRISDRMNETRLSERMNDSRDRLNERIERMNESRDRLNERGSECRISERMNETRMSERGDRDRMNESRIERMSDRSNDSRLNDSRIERMSDRSNDSRLNESRLEDRRKSDLNSSIRIEGSPKMRTHMSPLRIQRSSPKNLPKEHPRQSSSDSGKQEFFVPPPMNLSPLSPNTEESLLSDDDERRSDQVYSNDPEPSKCLGPDSQYEPVREEKEEILKTNHHHCYSDTNTMDSGWQSGSEKQVTD